MASSRTGVIPEKLREKAKEAKEGKGQLETQLKTTELGNSILENKIFWVALISLLFIVGVGAVLYQNYSAKMEEKLSNEVYLFYAPFLQDLNSKDKKNSSEQFFEKTLSFVDSKEKAFLSLPFISEILKRSTSENVSHENHLKLYEKLYAFTDDNKYSKILVGQTLASLYENNGNYKKAHDLYQEFLKSKLGTQHLFKLQLARMQIELGQLEEAKTNLSQIVADDEKFQSLSKIVDPSSESEKRKEELENLRVDPNVVKWAKLYSLKTEMK